MMRTAFRPLILIAATAAIALPVGARAQEAQDQPGTANTWQEQEKLERERQEKAQKSFDDWNQGQAQYQQQLQEQQQRSQGSRGASGGSGSASNCNSALARNRDLAPLASKVNLGHVDEQSSPLFDIRSGPTASEKPLLRSWLAGRRACTAGLWNGTGFRGYANSRWGPDVTNAMIVQLIAGKLSYGQFNRQRAANYIAYARYLAMHGLAQ
jgi:hypothetical protein